MDNKKAPLEIEPSGEGAEEVVSNDPEQSEMSEEEGHQES